MTHHWMDKVVEITAMMEQISFAFASTCFSCISLADFKGSAG